MLLKGYGSFENDIVSMSERSIVIGTCRICKRHQRSFKFRIGSMDEGNLRRTESKFSAALLNTSSGEYSMQSVFALRGRRLNGWSDLDFSCRRATLRFDGSSDNINVEGRFETRGLAGDKEIATRNGSSRLSRVSRMCMDSDRWSCRPLVGAERLSKATRDVLYFFCYSM